MPVHWTENWVNNRSVNMYNQAWIFVLILTFYVKSTTRVKRSFTITFQKTSLLILLLKRTSKRFEPYEFENNAWNMKVIFEVCKIPWRNFKKVFSPQPCSSFFTLSPSHLMGLLHSTSLYSFAVLRITGIKLCLTFQNPLYLINKH